MEPEEALNQHAEAIGLDRNDHRFTGQAVRLGELTHSTEFPFINEEDFPWVITYDDSAPDGVPLTCDNTGIELGECGG